MSKDKAKLGTARSATEYRLSIGSAPTSRRSSMGESSSMAKFTGQDGLAASVGESSENAIQQVLLPKIRELSDSIITLDSNFTHLNFIHESLADLNESLGSLLYGIMSNSWCVEFSQAPHDIQDDLMAIKQLKLLEDEKNSLLREVSNIERGISRRKDEPDENSSGKGPQNKHFSQPLFPSSQVRKYRPYENKDKRKSTKTANNPHTENDEDYDDDTSSEASFVLNPTNMGISKSSQGYVGKNARSNNNNNSKLRRKSILHTIRNSIASGADLPIENGNVVNLGDLHSNNRISLGSGAARIVDGPMTKKRHSMFTGHIERTSTENRHSVANKGEKKMSTRPPFR
ncbi:Dam1p [Saccharomyces cerevisiae x Saccharomyces kudriavzevii VIN7]|uniref:DASH complex subunit DAM1 n=1 Tax=Saccharomyces cerevisiae x Saccharomyces kudriavzevii (strain VIN7) TaxID=1095631 RepID=H0GV54_SACCK|nr:Dam1p [Saccharomyces cerevisiae x Saccharomyces kudriavzevii VIN7]CAI5273578.1 AIS_HP2_G0019940.mRNA.1.CDS.1 [Saccharomyces cerevisiae]CAI6522810.1 AIS_HP2_G0019940.mRNA.1.CDS.1 [Saccharomyces cerevisiae]